LSRKGGIIVQLLFALPFGMGKILSSVSCMF
jgi:hypothetical protein